MCKETWFAYHLMIELYFEDLISTIHQIILLFLNAGFRSLANGINWMINSMDISNEFEIKVRGVQYEGAKWNINQWYHKIN